MSKRRKQEAVTICLYKVKDRTDETMVESETTSGNHCAWCGDPPDRFGSHGICVFHAQQLVDQAAARRRARLFLTPKEKSPARPLVVANSAVV